MAKNLKLNIKNTQIAKALNLSEVRDKLAKKKADAKPQGEEEQQKGASVEPEELIEEQKGSSEEEAPRIKARSKSVFAETPKRESEEDKPKELSQEEGAPSDESGSEELQEGAPQQADAEEAAQRASEKAAEAEAAVEKQIEEAPQVEQNHPAVKEEEKILPTVEEKKEEKSALKPKVEEKAPERKESPHAKHAKYLTPVPLKRSYESREKQPFSRPAEKQVKLGPTGRHINDILPPKRPAKVNEPTERAVKAEFAEKKEGQKDRIGPPKPGFEEGIAHKKVESKSSKFKEFKDVKPTKKVSEAKFDTRDRQGLRTGDEGQRWRKKRAAKQKYEEIVTIRPSSLKVRLPISIKDLASEMKLKASQLIEKLFLQGAIYTLNDTLDDETTIQLLGQEFDCEIAIDTSEEERIRITDKTVKEEIGEIDPALLQPRAPVAAFMGHVDHGKTSLIDAIRESNRVAGEAGAITQHIGAFKCKTAIGDIAILDTPGHEAFSEMRARGADVTDIVVLVVAGDEGLMPQTDEAIQHAKAAGVTIIVAINKCDKPAFDAEKVYRQLADHELLPEAWGGQTITVNCSAVTKEGINTLLEMLALQAEVLELRANPKARARGAVLESEMHKGMGVTTTLLVQNGTLHHGDAVVFGEHWGRVKTLRDEYGHNLEEAGPSTPVEITGLSGLPSAGEEFIVVENEKEAREISQARSEKIYQLKQQRRPVSIESLMSDSKESAAKKVLNVILRADVQGSLEALKIALMKIESEKVDLNIIFKGVGEISESDVQLAAASKAVIIGFHTQVESHAEPLIKQYGVKIKLHDVIYHAIDSTKEMMEGTLDRLAKEVERGKAEVRATFKSSQHGVIAGCLVTEGTVCRNHHLRVMRGGEQVWRGPISSLKRHKDDVKEVSKGFECGVLLSTNDLQEGDILETFEVTYIKQEL